MLRALLFLFSDPFAAVVCNKKCVGLSCENKGQKADGKGEECECSENPENGPRTCLPCDRIGKLEIDGEITARLFNYTIYTLGPFWHPFFARATFCTFFAPLKKQKRDTNGSHKKKLRKFCLFYLGHFSTKEFSLLFCLYFQIFYFLISETLHLYNFIGNQ